MIARQWHGRVRTAQADEYFAYLQRTGLSDYASTPGNRGVFVFRRAEESWEAIRAFAGEDVEVARYYPEDNDYLLEREPAVTHYEVLDL